MFLKVSGMSVKAKVFGTSILLLLLLAGSSIYSYLSMTSLGKELISIAEHDIPLTANLSKVAQHQLEQALHLEKAIRHAELADLRNDLNEQELYKKEVRLFKEIEQKVSSEIIEGLQLAKGSLENAKTDSQINEFQYLLTELERINVIYQNFIKHSYEMFHFIDTGDLNSAEEIFHQVEDEEEELDHGLVALSEEITQFTAEAALAAEHHEQASVNIMAVIAIISIISGLTLSILLVRSIHQQLGADPSKIKQITDEIAAGKLNSNIGLDHENAIGVLSSLLTMRDSLRESIEKERRLASEATRIKQALDVTSGNIMVADANNKIIYLNNAVKDMFRTAEPDIKKDLPDFDVSQLLGSNIDQFHKQPEHQQKLMKGLSGRLDSGFIIGGRTMKFTANPVIAENNERLGTVVEWADHTAQVAIQKEIEHIIASVRSGDLNQSIRLDDKDGFFREVSKGMNELTTTIALVFEEVTTVINAMSQGNLQYQMRGDYQGSFGEVQQNFNTTIQSLFEIITSIRSASELITSGSDEISTANNNLSSQTEQQAASLEKTTTAIKEMSVTVRKNADNAHYANQLATGASQTASEGGKIVTKAITAVEEINHSSKKISEIVGVIEEIAFQTNLLSLNASVEAARAGEQGRGFAVVASEVRNLALRSASSAKEIKELIQDSVQKVEVGSELVNQSGEALENIMSSIIKVGDIVSEISTESQKQAEGIDQISQSVINLDELTQQNSALAEQTSSASSSMNEQAVAMNTKVEFFQTGTRVITESTKQLPKQAQDFETKEVKYI